MNRGSWVVKGFFWGMVLLYIVLFSILTVLKHEAFQTTYFDLEIFNQAAWNTHQGRILATSNVTQNAESLLAQHFQPILIPLSLLYFIHSGPESLLLVQAVIVALGALPAFWLAKGRLGSPWAGLVFSLAYLLFPALQAANMFDFHPVTLSPLFILSAFYFLQRRRYPLFLVFSLLLMSCQEEMPFLVFMMGLYIFLIQRERKVGVATMALAALWFYLAYFVVITHFSQGAGSPYLSFYAYLGKTPGEIGKNLLLKPWLLWRNPGQRVDYLVDLFTPVAFTSLLSPPTVAILLPSLALNLLSTYPPMNVLERFQYGAPLVPIVIISSIYGTAFLVERGAKRWGMKRERLLSLTAILILSSTLAYHRFHGFTPLSIRFQTFQVTEHQRLANHMMALIPPKAIVSAQSRLAPHLGQRERIYLFPTVEDAEYVFFDVTADSWPIHPNDQRALLESLIEEKGFGILAAKDGYILLKRGLVGAKELPDEFYDFARVKEPQIEYPMVVDFAHLMRFLGFDLHQEKGMTSLTLYWQALVPLERDYRPYPFFYDDGGRTIEDTTLRPMTTVLWYPTSKWKVGEVVQMKTLPWEVGEDFRVGLGVLAEGEWPQLEERLPLEVVTSTLVISPFDGDTALELLQVRGQTPLTPRRLFEPPPISHPLQVNLDHKFTLLGYDISPEILKPGERLRLTLYWQALTRIDKDYSVFTHLLDEGGQIRGQKDGFPADGTRPTSGWVKGEIVMDEYTISLPKDAPRGRYTLAAGMYDITTGERLATFDQKGGRIPQDKVILTTLEVRP